MHGNGRRSARRRTLVELSNGLKFPVKSNNKLSLSASASLIALYLLLNVCSAETHDVLCKAGNTRFEAYFHTGIDLIVGPVGKGGLATRSCEATLSGKEDVVVASDVAEIDLDMFGVDLEDNEPVAAFQIKKSQMQCCMTYQIYSLEDPPRLLRTISGGQFFSAADRDLVGRIEIWTDDAAAIDGLEGLRVSEIEFVPTYVLRFEHGRLLDVSSEFQDFADQMIAKVREKINPADLQRFKASDGKLQKGTGMPPEASARLPRLRRVKIQVLEIVWAYLYSGREKEAWRALADRWPNGDVERIRSEIIAARARGMHAQLDGVSNGVVPTDENPVMVYDSTDKPAKPIMVRYYPPSGATDAPLLKGKVRVNLVVDSAGKVRSVKVSGKQEASEYLKRSTDEWKFIPALVEGRPVASRVRMTLTLAQ
jgi:hypothetical protein